MNELDTDTTNIANHIVGTCMSIEEALVQLELSGRYSNETNLNTELFDSLVFRCSCCEWWCSVDELNSDTNSDQVCDDCYERE